MQLNEAEQLARNITKGLREYFGNKVDNFSIFNVMDKPHIEFTIEFEAYNFFILYLNYDRGRFGCAIKYGNSGISLENSQKWYDKADMNIFFQELEQQLVLRIPDKFLEYYGWK